MNQSNIPVVWLSVKEGTPGRGYWDQTLLERFFKDMQHHESITPDMTGAIVVIPGAYQGEYIDQINEELNKLEWCLVILTSDEESKFPANELKHDRMIIFSNYPNHKYEVVNQWLPIGPARNFRDFGIHDMLEKRLNWAFSGQITHPGREGYAKILRYRKDGYLNETKGFAQGLEHYEYHQMLSDTITVPAPSGPCSPDSFRLYEAIEAGAVPIPHNPEFWSMLFKDPKFPIIENYDQLNGYIDDVVDQYPKVNNRVQAWWIQEQFRIKKSLQTALDTLTGFTMPAMPPITVIIPVSPIKSHPMTNILDETVKSVRVHLPTAKIIVTFDGVREEQEDRRNKYEEFIRRIMWKCNTETEWENVLPLIFEEHTHQVGMAREALRYVDTPLILYCEQDTPLTPDVPIEWESVMKVLLSGRADVVRFHFESFIPKEHKHMMIQEFAQMYGKDHKIMKYMKTCQWSQRPHASTTAYYRRILENHFSENAKSFIEDKMHSVAHEAYLKDGEQGWQQHKIMIYLPDGNIKRSYHTDGREGEAKFDDTQVF
jgi:hypothetical protein